MGVMPPFVILDSPPPSGTCDLTDRVSPAGVADSAMGAGFWAIKDDIDGGSNTVRTNGALHVAGLWHNDLISLGTSVKEMREHRLCGHAKFLGANW